MAVSAIKIIRRAAAARSRSLVICRLKRCLKYDARECASVWMGDYFIMDSSGNRKRLSRYYIDEKIPVSERKQEIVLADGDHVIWAVPGRISNAYKVTEETKQVLVVMMTLN